MHRVWKRPRSMRGRVHSRWSFVAAAQAFRTARGERHDGSLSLRRPRLRFYDGTNKMVDGASLNGVESTLKCPIASTGERPKLAGAGPPTQMAGARPHRTFTAGAESDRSYNASTEAPWPNIAVRPYRCLCRHPYRCRRIRSRVRPHW